MTSETIIGVCALICITIVISIALIQACNAKNISNLAANKQPITPTTKNSCTPIAHKYYAVISNGEFEEVEYITCQTRVGNKIYLVKHKDGSIRSHSGVSIFVQDIYPDKEDTDSTGKYSKVEKKNE